MGKRNRQKDLEKLMNEFNDMLAGLKEKDFETFKEEATKLFQICMEGLLTLTDRVAGLKEDVINEFIKVINEDKTTLLKVLDKFDNDLGRLQVAGWMDAGIMLGLRKILDKKKVVAYKELKDPDTNLLTPEEKKGLAEAYDIDLDVLERKMELYHLEQALSKRTKSGLH